VQIFEYLDSGSRSPFGNWFNSLDASAAAKVTVALTRIGEGNWSNVKGVGAGVLEFRIHFGPGYRIYFGRDGDHLVILLGGGSKHRQQKDIRIAAERWLDYRRRKMQGT
jgi:putative addiction module killer protein